MPMPDGSETPDERRRRLLAASGGAAPPPTTPEGATSAITSALTTAASAPNTQVSGSQGAYFVPYSGSKPTLSGSNGAQQAFADNTLGSGVGFRDVRPTGIVQQGSVGANGQIQQGVVKAAEDEYDPAAYANLASGTLQAPTVTGAAPVAATGNAILTSLANPNVAGNQYIAPGQAAANQQGNLALGAANNIAGAGAGNAATQQGILAGAQPLQQPAMDAQSQLINLLSGAAAGNGPSAAQPLFQQSLDRVIGAGAAQAANVRGASAVGAARNAGAQATAAGLDAASQAAALRAQEQQNAQTQLGQVTQGARAGDVALSTVLGSVTGQARQQDIDTAKATSDAIQGVRDGTIKAADVFSTATNALNQTNGQIAQWAVQNGLDYGKLLQAAQAGDQTAALQLTQIMANYSASKYSVTKQGNVAERGQNIGVASGLGGGVLNGAGGAIVKAVT